MRWLSRRQPDKADRSENLAHANGKPAMSRRDFGRGVALAAPVVLAGGMLERPRSGSGPGSPSAADATDATGAVGLHGVGGRFGVLGTAEGAESYGVYGYAGGAGAAALGGGAAAPGSYGADLGVTGAHSIGVRSEAAGEHSTAVSGLAHADWSAGVHGIAHGADSAGILADASPAHESSHALWAEGRAHVNGTLSHSSAGFKIDHPLRPATHYLSHSVVESNERKTVYDGVATLGSDGRVLVQLPNWFEALNSDFRYQLTAIGGSSPDLHIAAELDGNRFEIAGGRAGGRVCWMVTAVRRDPAAVAERLEVERAKADEHAGSYLRPELHGAERSLRPGRA